MKTFEQERLSQAAAVALGPLFSGNKAFLDRMDYDDRRVEIVTRERHKRR